MAMSQRQGFAWRRISRTAAALLLAAAFLWAPALQASAEPWSDRMPSFAEDLPDRCLARVLSFDQVLLERDGTHEPDALARLGFGSQTAVTSPLAPPLELDFADPPASLDARAGCRSRAPSESAATLAALPAGFGAIGFMPEARPERSRGPQSALTTPPPDRFDLPEVGMGPSPRGALRPEPDPVTPEPSPLRSGSWDPFEPMSTSIANGVSMLTPRGYDLEPAGGFGMEYSVRRGWVLRAGAQLNRSALPDSFRDFQGVDERTRVGVGLSYALSPRVELDLAYLYALSERENEMKIQAPAQLPFSGEMRSSASEGMIGVTLRYRF
jgi:hypothetical protein